MSDFNLTIKPADEIRLKVEPAAEIKLSLSVGQGPAGAPGASAGTLLPPFNFATPITPWVINHNLRRRPLVSAFTVGKREMLQRYCISTTIKLP